jgi:glycosyltransferase involved in cell wall biosynthesis
VKILLVHNSYQQPGGEDVVFNLERQLLESAGHEVSTYCRSNWEASNLSPLGRVTLLKGFVWADDSRREMVELLQRTKPDVVHIHNTFFMISPSIYSACQEMNVPVVQTLHNYRLLCPKATLYRDGHVCEECLDHGVWRGVYHGCYRDSRLTTAATALMLEFHRQRGTWNNLVRCYVALTQFARQKFIQGGLPADRIRVKPNFVQDPGARTGGGDYGLFVGRLTEDKGVLTLVKAWRQLKQQIPLRIAGDGPLRAQLEAEIARSGQSTVSLLGQISHDEILEAMKQARFLVFPSEWYEGFPMTIVEALGCGLPVICPSLGSMQEIVEDGRTGLHFRPRDAEDLACKVEWAWSHPAGLEQMGRQARTEYETHYTSKHNYAALMDIYQEAITASA